MEENIQQENNFPVLKYLIPDRKKGKQLCLYTNGSQRTLKFRLKTAEKPGSYF